MLDFNILNANDLLVKILLSILLGFIIGMDRELTNKSAGLRTHILVCLGATVFTIISIYGFTGITYADGAKITRDPARIAAQILTGIGFIGGGAVLHHGGSISGLTTAASLWIASSIGMAVGTGQYELAILATITSLIVLVVIRKLNKILFSSNMKKGSKIKIAVECNPEYTSDIQVWFYREFENIYEMTIQKSSRDTELTKMSFIIDMFNTDKKIKPIKR